MTAPRSDADAIRAWLDEKGALASKATEGPWVVAPPSAWPWYRDGCGEKGEDTLTIIGAHGYGVFSVPESITDGPVKTNVDFIADARTSLPAALDMVRVLVESHGRISGMSPNAGVHMVNESLTALSRVRRIAEVGHGATSDALRIKERG